MPLSRDRTFPEITSIYYREILHCEWLIMLDKMVKKAMGCPNAHVLDGERAYFGVFILLSQSYGFGFSHSWSQSQRLAIYDFFSSQNCCRCSLTKIEGTWYSYDSKQCCKNKRSGDSGAIWLAVEILVSAGKLRKGLTREIHAVLDNLTEGCLTALLAGFGRPAVWPWREDILIRASFQTCKPFRM
jgi:hypothetical protein